MTVVFVSCRFASLRLVLSCIILGLLVGTVGTKVTGTFGSVAGEETVSWVA